ncbi:MAG: response regulator receiver protein [Acidobacteriales bacterium]|nr:response regulator receiver protein [Terriglobales bacterium]
MPKVALVVDDSMLIRHTVCRFLEERGYAVESATNGKEAMEILKTVLPDLIITDMQMPKMDGTELITTLKASSTTANIPVVLLQGKKNHSDPDAETRANYVIYKDIDIVAQLGRALAVTLGREIVES